MDQPSGSIQSRGPPASTWLNTMQRACGETLVTVCHCPDAHLQSPNGGKESAGGGGGTLEGRGACFWLTASSDLQRGRDMCGKVDLGSCRTSNKRSEDASLNFEDLNPDFSKLYTAYTVWESVIMHPCTQKLLHFLLQNYTVSEVILEVRRQWGEKLWSKSKWVVD